MTKDKLKELLRTYMYDEDVVTVMAAVEAYSSASNGAKPIVSRDVLPEERPFKECDLDATGLQFHNQFCNCKLNECKKLEYRIAWRTAYGQHNG